jgi:hypothetical protein
MGISTDSRPKVQAVHNTSTTSRSVPLSGFYGQLELLCGEGVCGAAIEDAPVATYTMELADDDLLDDLFDDSSCDSTISSKCSIATDRGVRVGFHDLSSRSRRPSIIKGQDSQKSEKSAHFNDSLNKTMVYTPDPETNSSVDKKSVKSEGGKVKHFDGSMKFLDDQRFDVSVVGTSSRDDSVHPRVLNLPIMDALQEHLPYSKRGQLFWLRYSMVRDGASIHTLINKTAGSKYNLIAIETMDGEVFGAFTAQPWNVTWKFYGSTDSFLWRLNDLRDPSGAAAARKTKARRLDHDIDVFKFAGNNRNIQLCTSDSLIVGGGHPDDASVQEFSDIKLSDWGFGLSFGKDLQRGTSSPCITFESPSLSRFHQDGSFFEVSNIEIWSLTPCMTLEQAIKMEDSKRCLEKCPTF